MLPRNKEDQDIGLVAAIGLFIGLSIIASTVSLAKLWGAPGQSFTLFEFIGPLPAALLGPVWGILAILAGKLAPFLFDAKMPSAVDLLRLLPAVAGAFFFATYAAAKASGGRASASAGGLGSRSKTAAGGFRLDARFAQVALPILCIGLFVAHPIGGTAWLFSLYWLIPPVLAILRPAHVFWRSLGTTFTQHAVGGVVWLYFVAPMSPEAWLALIPIVAVERLVFASGMSVSMVALETVLKATNAELVARKLPALALPGLAPVRA